MDRYALLSLGFILLVIAYHIRHKRTSKLTTLISKTILISKALTQYCIRSVLEPYYFGLIILRETVRTEKLTFSKFYLSVLEWCCNVWKIYTKDKALLKTGKQKCL